MEKEKMTYENEEWKYLDFTKDKYQVSNYGRIKSFCHSPKEGKIVKVSNIKGFNAYSFMVGKKKKQFYVHKLVADAFVKKEDTTQAKVIHLDWNKLNNHYKNLQWVTTKESYKRIQDKLKSNVEKTGKSSTAAKLVSDDVILLKYMLEKGIKQNVLAKLFAISEMQVTRIKRKENWANIQVPDNYKI
ncbi:MAG: hypothetical protein HN704_03860 [Bacteroidetes bacterium]|jgi:hypothetical protein|nr:hypothetical protein [Bacteroidota bacterium]MBT6684784.1 hypothetical protein [Bacteroidota bacterium]MBT7141760.1 hypothetical protein [Bacteroidota bacterium]MBT7490728.1 hypothetical protein [Bacteroidota bacterium]